MLDNYKDEYAKIPVPANLKAETLLKMLAEKKKKQKWMILKIAMAASCFMIAVVSYFYMQPSYIKTKLKSDSTIAKVEVSDGNLVFEKVDSLRQFGNLFTTKKQITETIAKEILKEGIKDRSIEGYQMKSREYFGYYTNFTLFLVEVVETYNKGNQEITVSYKESKKDIETNSIIDNKKIAIVYKEDKQETMYSSLYKEDAILYEIVGNGMTQEQYINNLVSFLKNFK